MNMNRGLRFYPRRTHYRIGLTTLSFCLAAFLIAITALLPNTVHTAMAGPAAQANCVNNKVKNSSFESGKDGWIESGVQTGSGGNYAVDGSQYRWIRLADPAVTGTFYQEILGVMAHSHLELTFAAGTHEPNSYIHEGYLEFYDDGDSLIGTSPKVDIDFDVESSPPLLEEYSIEATAPVGTSYIRIVFWLNGDYIKLDDVVLKSCEPLGSIGDTVWSDPDNDGNSVIDGDDFAIEGVVVKLLDSNGNFIEDDTTGPNGGYLFTELEFNTYIIEIDTSTLPDVKQGNPAYDPDGGNDSRSTVTLTPDTPNNLDQDFAYFQTLGSIGDTVWSDPDDDGNSVIDGDDFPIEDVEVILLDEDGAVVKTDTTDDGGRYLFTQLPLNKTYTVRVNTSTLPDIKQGNLAYDPDGGDDSESEVRLTVDNPDNLDQDFAYFQTLGSIGDTVWSDPDNDGNSVIDGDDFAIEGVLVRLLDSNNEQIATDTTNGSGQYLFTQLPLNATYTVQVDTSTLPDIKQVNPAYDPDDGGDSKSEVELTLANPDNLDQDFAYFQTLGSIGDTVWSDPDNDGNSVIDGDDFAIADVVVMLFTAEGAPLGTDTTDDNGQYLFTQLPLNQTYIVRIDTTTLPEIKQVNPAYDPDGGNDNESEVTLNVGNPDNRDQDFAYFQTAPTPTNTPVPPTPTNTPVPPTPVPPTPTPTNTQTPVALASLGDRVWKDTNSNGQQDAGEPGIPDIVVNLYSESNGSTDTFLGSKTTTSLGIYKFTELDPSQNYIVEFVLPNGYQFTGQDAAAGNGQNNDEQDSDADPNTGLSHIVDLDPGEDDPTIDVGIVELPDPTPAPTASLGDRVWKDANENGIQDEGEESVDGVTVNLWLADTDGAPLSKVDSMSTANGGQYMFTGLTPSQPYVVQLDTSTIPSYCAGLTTPNSGDDASDSDIDPATGISAPVVLSPGETNTSIDAGLVPTDSSLGNRVWKDANGNGIQDDGEAGVPDVPVTLWIDNDGNGTPDSQVESILTDSSGVYLFTDLDPSKTYIVQFGMMPTMPYTDMDQGDDDEADSDVDPSSGITGPITIEPGENKTDVDAGMIDLPAALGDKVWKDRNRNGLQDRGEEGVAGVTVALWTDDDGDGTPDTAVQIQQTDAQGGYLFEGLDPHKIYIVQVETPEDCDITDPDQGDDQFDSDIDPATGTSAPITLEPGETNTTTDIGLTPIVVTASLGNYVWLDDNANGIQDNGEPGIQGVIVTLLNAAGEAIATTATDEDGGYSFDNLTPGEYSVKFELPDGNYFFTLQDTADETMDSDVDPATGQTVVTELSANENDPKWDAGVIAPPILDVQKSPDSEVIQQNELIDFDITYSNRSLSAAPNVIISEIVPRYTTFVPELSTEGWGCENDSYAAGSVCTIAVGNVPGGSTNEDELHFVVRVDRVVNSSITMLLNQIQIRDDGSHPSGVSGQAIDEATVVVRHPTSLGSVDEGEVNQSRTFLYLPVVRRNLFKSTPTTLLTTDEWRAVWACGVATNPQLQWDTSIVGWATAVCSAVAR